jgi:hypothetical protein
MLYLQVLLEFLHGRNWDTGEEQTEEEVDKYK